MTNRISRLTVWEHRLDPAEAEIVVSVFPDRAFSTTQVRGRLKGPHCPYASTVELAYPLRETSREYETTGIPRITSRVVIPEPNLWDPQSPFLYEGGVELWQGNECCDRVALVRGLRTLRLGRGGLLVNGRLAAVKGVRCATCSPDEARQLHDAGYNTILIPVGEGISQIAETADRYGLLVIGHVSRVDQLKHARALPTHSSFLGWLMDPASLEHPLLTQAPDLLPSLLASDAIAGRTFVGIEVKDQATHLSLPSGISFLACREELLCAAADVSLPKLLLDAGLSGSAASSEGGFMGRIQITPGSPPAPLPGDPHPPPC